MTADELARKLAAAERRAWRDLARSVALLVVMLACVLLMGRAIVRGAWPEAIFWLLTTRGLPYE